MSTAPGQGYKGQALNRAPDADGGNHMMPNHATSAHGQRRPPARSSHHEHRARPRLIVSGATLVAGLMIIAAACDSGGGVDKGTAAYLAAHPTTSTAKLLAATTTTSEAPTTTTSPATTSTAAPTTTAAVTSTTAAIGSASAAAFTTASSYHDQSLGQITPDLEVAGLRVYCDEAAQIDGQFIQELNTTTFAAAVQPLVNTLIGALTASQQLEHNCAAAQSAGAADALWNDPASTATGQAAIDAEAAVRTALGLPPLGG